MNAFTEALAQLVAVVVTLLIMSYGFGMIFGAKGAVGKIAHWQRKQLVRIGRWLLKQFIKWSKFVLKHLFQAISDLTSYLARKCS